MAATYKGLLTNNGKALIASATLNNKINYSHIAVGDGNGSVPNPLETRTALVNEKARIALNVVEINPKNTNQIICEAIIPSNLGGFYIRELGLYAGATMVVNASYPPTYKPLVDEGGAREIAIKLVINIQNAEVIALYLDDSLIYATRSWVDTNYIRRNELVDNLTTDDASKPVSAKQAKNLQDNKLDKTANAASATKLNQSRKIGGVSFDATKDIDLPGVNIQGNQNTSGVVLTWLDNGFSNSDMSIDPEAAWNDSGRVTAKFTNSNNALAINVSGLHNERKVMIQSGHDTPTYADVHGELQLNPLGGPVTANGSKVITVSEGIAVSATRLQNPRTVFGQTFDGSSDIGGTVTASTGLVQTDSFHYIDMGRNGLDRMNFYNYGATFNFIDSQNGNVVARITQNGIDCNAASASKLKVPRKINNVDFDGTSDITVTDDALTYMPIPYPKSSPPTGYLAMMGQAISESTYPKLYALYGAVLPDMRAYSVRGLDYGRGIDVGRSVLSQQEDAIQNIKGSLKASSQYDRNTQFIDSLVADGAFSVLAGDKSYTGEGSGWGQAWGTEFDASRVVRTSTETRIKNIAFLYIVKAG